MRREQAWSQETDDAVGAWAKSGEDLVLLLCQHYNIPLVSIRAALMDMVKTDAAPQFRLPSWLVDCVHPNSQGHTFIAEMVLSRIFRHHSWREPRGTRTTFSGKARCLLQQERRPPAPLHPTGDPTSGATVCVRGLGVLPLIAGGRAEAARHGFVMTEEGRRKAGLVAQSPNSSLSLCLRPIQTAHVAILGHLVSYAGGMGQALVSCFGSCSCTQAIINSHLGPDQRRVSITKGHRILLLPMRTRQTRREVAGGDGNCACRLTVRVLPQSLSRGHKFKVISLTMLPCSHQKRVLTCPAVYGHSFSNAAKVGNAPHT